MESGDPVAVRGSQAGCPRCGSRQFWTLKDGRRRCARCRYDWKPRRLPLRLTPQQWRDLLRWFVRGLSSGAIAAETGLERKRVLRALMLVRQAMARDVPPEFRRVAGSERAAVSGAHDQRRRTAARSPGRQLPVLGLAVARGRAWVEVVPETAADTLRRALRERGQEGPIGPALLPYQAVAYRGRFYRLASGARTATSGRFGELEGFWGYVRRQLRSKGGIRRERLGLYLAEYAWRYNRRRLSPAEQVRDLLKLLNQPRASPLIFLQARR